VLSMASRNSPFSPWGRCSSISFNKRCGMLPVCRQNSWGNSQSSIWSEACEFVCRLNGVEFAFQSLQSTARHEVGQHLLHIADPLLG